MSDAAAAPRRRAYGAVQHVAPPPLMDAGRDLYPAVLVFMAGFLAVMAALSLYNVRYLPLLLAAGMLLCVAVPVIRWPVFTSVAWLLIVGTSPESWLGDILGEQQSLITAVGKVLGLALLAVCIVRFGARFDPFNPGLAFCAMFVIGFAHGTYPTLTFMDSFRSLIGSAAPFAFSFSRLSRRWCDAIANATIWVAPVVVGFGVVLALTHVRPLFVELGGFRLQASTIPAFLGGFATTGIYASVLELYRDGRRRHLWGLVLNYVILVLSGARAPLAAAFFVTAAAFFFLRSDSFPAKRRLPLILAGMLVAPLMVAAASGSNAIRLFDFLSGNGTENLSGRDLLWPYFEAAWHASPTFGWGVGAARMIIDPDSLFAKLIGTTAAHNEYLRMGVEGGYVGLTLLIGMMLLWVLRWTRHARRTDRFIMRCVFVAFAVHSFTDNTLIAATASVLFTWVSAVFARAALENESSSAATEEATSAEQRRGQSPQIA